MFKVNDNYLKLPGSYLFSTIGKKVAAYKAENPDRQVISLGIGDVTQPLAPAVIKAMHSAVDEMADAATFHGYAPDLGYEFLRKAIVYTFTVLSFFGGACLGAWSVYTFNVRGAYIAFVPLAAARILIAVGERPAEDETPTELAKEATEEAEEAVLLEEELPK